MNGGGEEGRDCTYVDESGEGRGGGGGEALERVFVAHFLLIWSSNENVQTRYAMQCSHWFQNEFGKSGKERRQ